MGPANIAFLAALVALTVVVSVLVARLMQYQEAAASCEDIDFTRYAPMGRLFNPEEAAFLASQPGSTPQQLRAFRKSRRRIFRGYLRELTADFQALHSEARLIVAASPEKNPDLVEMLMRQQVQFWASILRLEVQLILDAGGMGKIDPRGLLGSLSALHSAVTQASTVPGPVVVR